MESYASDGKMLECPRGVASLSDMALVGKENVVGHVRSKDVRVDHLLELKRGWSIFASA